MFIKFNRAIMMIAAAMMRLLFFLHMPASAQELKYGAEESFVEVHGFMDLVFLDFEADGKREGESTFDNRHFNVFFKSDIRENLSIIAEVEYEHGGKDVELDRGEVQLNLSEAAIVKAGRFYTPFGIERLVWYANLNKFVSRPLPLLQIVPGNWYANGVQLMEAISAFVLTVGWAEELDPPDLTEGSKSGRYRSLLDNFSAPNVRVCF
ncbi:hypothetical protein IH992_20135 [Candidatus Poribacteria bacterium]|nr:hypothetical protein [Candidatus Poribacteria bacterium]